MNTPDTSPAETTSTDNVTRGLDLGSIHTFPAFMNNPKTLIATSGTNRPGTEGSLRPAQADVQFISPINEKHASKDQVHRQ